METTNEIPNRAGMFRTTASGKPASSPFSIGDYATANADFTVFRSDYSFRANDVCLVFGWSFNVRGLVRNRDVAFQLLNGELLFGDDDFDEVT